MDQNLFQTIDQPQDNPIMPELTPTPKPHLSKKIIILAILIFFIIILLIVSLFIPRSPSNSTLNDQIIPSLSISATPTIINQPNQIPEIYKSDFGTFDLLFNAKAEFLPPQIDINTGL